MIQRLSFIVAMCISLAACVQITSAQTLWTEDAESGSTHIIDNTTGGYSLIQSDVVGQGNNAFHLANPEFQDNWFELDTTVAVQANTKLFFLSQLRYATPTQIARVQISTNGGSTWPTNLFSQAGSDGSGEGAYSLKQIDLGSYANQNLRFRFYYEFTGGFAFTDTDSNVGWFIDDIQIGSELQKTQWSIGNPTAHEQQYLEYVNRARADAIVEANRLANETDPDITSAYSFFGVTGQNIVNQFQWYVDNGHMEQHAQPLSFHSALLTAAQLHTQDMYDNEFQGHNSSSNPPVPFPPNATLSERLDAVGYSGGFAENVYSYADSVAQGHAGFDVDWGDTSNPASPAYNPAFAGQGMQNPSGHRINMHNGDYSEVGIGVINGTNGSVGPQLVTQDFGDPGVVRYITGAVYEDLNGNSFYDIGEGREGVRIDVDGSGFFAISTASGGYSVPVSEDGQYDVTFSGGNFATYSTDVSVSNGWNTKLDYLVSAAMLDGDYNNDGIVNIADYVGWRDTMSDNLAGYDTWRANFGAESGAASSNSLIESGTAAVPEPSAVFCLAVSSIFLLGYGNRTRSRQASGLWIC